MHVLQKDIVRPALCFAGGLAALVLITLLTSPVQKIGYAILFFAALLFTLVSLGYLVMRLWGAKPSPKNRYRIFIISLFIVVALMFRSAQSLNWTDALIVLLVAFGLLFYGGRRF